MPIYSLRSSRAADGRRATPRRFARDGVADRTITGDQSSLDMLAKLLPARKPEIRNVQVPVVADSGVYAPAIERRVVGAQADARQIVAFAEVDRFVRQWLPGRIDDLDRVYPRELRWIRSKQMLRITERPAAISHEIHFAILLSGKIRGSRPHPVGRHSRVSGNPASLLQSHWVPAFAGTTTTIRLRRRDGSSLTRLAIRVVDLAV